MIGRAHGWSWVGFERVLNFKGQGCGTIGECNGARYNGDIEEKTEAQPLVGLRNLCGCASDANLCFCIVNGTRRSRAVSSDDLFLHTCTRSAPTVRLQADRRGRFDWRERV